jgi:endoglucanase
MEIKMKSLLKKLSEVVALPGYEKNIREVIIEEIKPFVDEYSIDPLGNLIARKGKKTENGLRVMITAHMDEIGLVVSHVDENGFVKFKNNGALYGRNMVSSRVQFLNGTKGMVYAEKFSDETKVPTLNQLFIDVGATSPADCPVKIGDMAGLEGSFIDLGDRVISKAMDNRVGVAVLIQALKSIENSPHEIYFVFTAQEEVGRKGAQVSGYSIHPDVGLAIDVTATGDTPQKLPYPMKLDAGPAIKIKDPGAISNRELVNTLRDIAESNNIPHQYEILEGGTTDASMMQIARSGVKVGALSIPCRYVHTPSEMVSIRDLENTLKLTLGFLTNDLEKLK